MQEITKKILLWSEKYTKTDMLYLTKGGFWLTVERITIVFFGIFVAVAFANLMEPEKYGVYKYVLSVASIAGAFALSGIHTTLGRAVARGFERTLQLAARHAFVWSLGSTLILFAVSGYYFINDNLTLSISFLIAGALSPALAAMSLYNSYLVGKKLFHIKSLFGIFAGVFPPALLLTTLFFTNNPTIFVLVYFAGNALALSLLFSLTIHKYPPNKSIEPKFLENSLHFSAMNIIETIAVNVDKILIFSQLGGTQLATYSFARLAPDQLRSLSGIIANLAFPKMATRSISELKKIIPRKALLLFALGLITTLIYIALAPLLFSILFPVYTNAIPLSQVFALTLPIALSSILFSQTLISHARKKELYTLKIATPTLRLILMLILLPLFGVWGIVFAIITTYILGNFLLLFLFFRMK